MIAESHSRVIKYECFGLELWAEYRPKAPENETQQSAIFLSPESPSVPLVYPANLGLCCSYIFTFHFCLLVGRSAGFHKNYWTYFPQKFYISRMRHRLLVRILKNRQILDCFLLTIFNISEIVIDFSGNDMRILMV